MDLISIIVPLYNAEQHIPKLEMLLEQTYENLEFIFVDDCSTDSTKQLLLELQQRHQEKLIQVISNDHNMGAGGSRNNGLAHTCEVSKYVYFHILRNKEVKHSG